MAKSYPTATPPGVIAMVGGRVWKPGEIVYVQRIARADAMAPAWRSLKRYHLDAATYVKFAAMVANEGVPKWYSHPASVREKKAAAIAEKARVLREAMSDLPSDWYSDTSVAPWLPKSWQLSGLEEALHIFGTKPAPHAGRNRIDKRRLAAIEITQLLRIWAGRPLRSVVACTLTAMYGTEYTRQRVTKMAP